MKNLRPTRAARALGFTLLEVVISTAIFSTLTIAFFGFVTVNLNAQNRSAMASDLMLQGNSALTTIASELRESSNFVSINQNSVTKTYPAFMINNHTGCTFVAPATAALFPGHSHTSDWSDPGSRKRYMGLQGVAPIPSVVNTSATGSLAYPGDMPAPPWANATAQNGNREIIFVKPKYQPNAWSPQRTPVLTLGKTTWDVTWNATGAVTGGAEYDFVVVQASDGVLELRERILPTAGGTTFPDQSATRVLARRVQWLYFSDSSIDSTLSSGQIRVSVWLASRDVQNTPQSLFLQTIVTLRNS